MPRLDYNDVLIKTRLGEDTLALWASGITKQAARTVLLKAGEEGMATRTKR